MNEGTFYRNKVRPVLNGAGDHERIENAVGTGTPDISYAINGIQGWIETKLIKSGCMYFEKYQLPWFKKRGKHAKDLYVLAYDTGSRVIQLYHGPALANGPTTRYRKWTVVKAEDHEASLTLIPPKYQWARLVEKLSEPTDIYSWR